MKFDRKARVLLLWVLLPLYLAMLAVFIYVSNVYMGKYPLPKQRLAEDYLAFAGGGYRLAQELSVSGRPLKPTTVVDDEIAEKIVKAYGPRQMTLAVLEPSAEFAPRKVDAARAGEAAGAGVFLVYPVNVGPPGRAVVFSAGSELTARTAAKIEAAAKSAGIAREITVVSAVGFLLPVGTVSAEFEEFVSAGYILQEAVTVILDGDDVVKEPGTIVDERILLALMEMRDGKLRDELLSVRGEGPVIGFQYTFVFILLNFAVLVVFLHGLMWKPILAVLDERKATVEDDLSQAHEHRRQAEGLHNKYRQQMQEARGDREEIIAGGRREGRTERERIITEAKAEAGTLRERAHLAIDSEREDVKQELTSRIGEFSTQLASKILAREVTADDHRSMVDDFLKAIGTSEEDQT